MQEKMEIDWKKCKISLVIKKIQIKTIMKFIA